MKVSFLQKTIIAWLNRWDESTLTGARRRGRSPAARRRGSSSLFWTAPGDRAGSCAPVITRLDGNAAPWRRESNKRQRTHGSAGRAAGRPGSLLDEQLAQRPPGPVPGKAAPHERAWAGMPLNEPSTAAPPQVRPAEKRLRAQGRKADDQHQFFSPDGMIECQLLRNRSPIEETAKDGAQCQFVQPGSQPAAHAAGSSHARYVTTRQNRGYPEQRPETGVDQRRKLAGPRMSIYTTARWPASKNATGAGLGSARKFSSVMGGKNMMPSWAGHQWKVL